MLDAAGTNLPTGTSQPGLQAHCSNAMILGADEEDLAGALTPAHEAGHMLGLTNAEEASSIMGPRSSTRRLLPRDQQLIHRAIERNLSGISRPLNYQTSGSLPPYELPGELPATR